MKGKRDRKKIADLKRRPMRQNNGLDEELRALALSWLACPAHDIIITPGLVVVDGHRRLEGLSLLGETEVEVFITEEEMDEKAILQVGLSTAIHRADLSGYDKWQACLKLQELHPGWQGKDLADFLHLSCAAVSHLRSPSKLPPEWIDALKAGKVKIADCYQASQRTPEQAAGLLALKLSNASGDEQRKSSRKSQSESTASARTSNVNIRMPGDQTVILRGSDLGMSEVVDLLAETLKEAKKAAEIYDVKTFQNMMRDKAKLG